jgi:hypothetical protein
MNAGQPLAWQSQQESDTPPAKQPFIGRWMMESAKSHPSLHQTQDQFQIDLFLDKSRMKSLEQVQAPFKVVLDVSVTTT